MAVLEKRERVGERRLVYLDWRTGCAKWDCAPVRNLRREPPEGFHGAGWTANTHIGIEKVSALRWRKAKSIERGWVRGNVPCQAG